MIEDYTIQPAEDYPLNSITGFENYLFVGSDRFRAEHTRLTGDILVSDGAACRTYQCGTDCGRSAAKQAFNAVLQGRDILSRPGRISCVLIDFADAANRYGDRDVEEIYGCIADAFRLFCRERHRAGVCVPHLYQGTRLPHCHILLERGRGMHNEFQNFLMGISGEEDERKRHSRGR